MDRQFEVKPLGEKGKFLMKLSWTGTGSDHENIQVIKGKIESTLTHSKDAFDIPYMYQLILLIVIGQQVE